MGKFSKSGGREMPELNTSSLPDLVFAFLFFIMMVTSMREVTPKVSYSNLPQATELTKLEEKSLVTFLYVGQPTEQYRAVYGTGSAIQLNDQITQNPAVVRGYVLEAKSKLKGDKKEQMVVSIKGDKTTKMKIISDIREELRRADALNVSYSARQGKNAK